MRIAIATEKPFISKTLAPFVRQHWPAADITFVHVVPYGNLHFRYPRGLKHADFPHTSEPRNRLSSWADWSCPPLAMAADGSLNKCAMSAEVLADADQVIYVGSDPASAVGFSVLIEHVIKAVPAAHCLAVWLHALDEASVKEAFAGMAPFPVVAQSALAYGQTKRYFDWNFNVNSLAVLGDAQRLAGGPTDAPPLSKYALQLLYALRKQGALPEGQVISLMYQWRGTGKYATSPRTGPQPGLGSVASRAQILENLQRADLVSRGEAGIEPTGRAMRLLERLHPGCEDADLPFRLHAWCELGPESRPVMDKYLRTFFGRQLRFAAEGHKERAPASAGA